MGMKTKDEGFETVIDGRRYWIEAGHEDKSRQLYAQAFLNARYVDTAFSDNSVEEAILSLVKKIENHV